MKLFGWGGLAAASGVHAPSETATAPAGRDIGAPRRHDETPPDRIVTTTVTAVAAERARLFIKRHSGLMKGAESFWRLIDAVPPPLGRRLQAVKRRMLRETGWGELTLVIDSLEAAGLPYWLAGGWGVDALVGRRTRRHKDVDLVIGDFVRDEPTARRVLQGLGFDHVAIDEGGVWMPLRSNFEDVAGHRVELMAIDWACVERALDTDTGGDATPGPRPALADEILTVGAIDGRRVPCLTASAQLLFHTGFPLEVAAQEDVDLLRSRAGLPT